MSGKLRDGAVEMKLCTVVPVANLGRMFRLLPLPLLPALRCLMLGLLAFALLANPVLAAGCGIADAGHVLEGEAHAPGDDDGDEWCCQDRECRACCPLTASPLPSSGSAAAVHASAPATALAVGFEPGGCSPPFRPPIAA